MTRKLARTILLVLATAILGADFNAVPVLAQAQQKAPEKAPMSLPKESVIKSSEKLPALGQACTRSDNKVGLVVQDACGRMFCGLKIGQQLLAAEMGLARKLGCEWRLVNDQCRCQYSPRAKKAK